MRLRIRQADLFDQLLDWERVTQFKESFENFGDPENQKKPTAQSKPSSVEEAAPASLRTHRRSEIPDEVEKKTYKNRLDVLTPAFRCGLAGVARLSGNLVQAELEITRAEEEAKTAQTTLFRNELRVEKARILLARGKRAEALLELEKDQHEKEKVAYRRADLERLLTELRANGELVARTS